MSIGFKLVLTVSKIQDWETKELAIRKTDDRAKESRVPCTSYDEHNRITLLFLDQVSGKKEEKNHCFKSEKQNVLNKSLSCELSICDFDRKMQLIS